MKNGNEGMSEIENLNKQIYQLKKNIELVKEDSQLEMMRRDQRISELEKINREHQDLNGRLRLELNRVKGGM